MFKKLILFLSVISVCFSLVACNKNPSNNSQTINPTEENETSSEMVSETKQPIASSYAVNEFEDATISNISVSGTVVTVEVTYTGELQLHLGSWFALEIYENGTWYTLPYKADIAWTQLAYPVEPNHSRSMEYDWNHAYDPLSSGKYRIVIEAIDFIETGNYTKHYLAAEFEIN